MKALLFATLALALAAPAGAAFADDYGYRRSHRAYHREHRYYHQDAARDHREAHEDGFYSRREHRR